MADIIPDLIFFVLTFSIVILLALRRRQTGVNALDWPISIFVATCLVGFFELIKDFYPDLAIFASEGESIGTDIVRAFHLIAILLIFLMAESFLADRLNYIRFGLVISILAMYVLVTIYYVVSGELIETSSVLGIGNQTVENTSYVEEFLFDLLQLIAIGELLFVYITQYAFAKATAFKNYLIAFIIAIALFAISSLYEVFEHIFPLSDQSAFLTSIPTFLLLAYNYYRFPNFVYLSASQLSFLQLITIDGVVLYAAQLKDDDDDTADFLLGPGLVSVNTMVEDVLNEDDVEIKKFVFNSMTIVFERIGNLRAILLTNRPAHILKRAMRYFLREFQKEFGDQIENYRGYIDDNEKGISPEDVFRRCLPMVESKEILSMMPKS